MAGIIFKDNAYGTITSTINALDSRLNMTITLTTGHGARFPQPVLNSTYFMFTLINSSNVLEHFICTQRTADSLVCHGAYDGSVAASFAPGDRIELRLINASVSEFDLIGHYKSFVTGVSSPDAINSTLITNQPAIPNGMQIRLQAFGANTIPAPTLTLTLDATSFGGVATTGSAKTIVKGNNEALQGADIPGAGYICDLLYSQLWDKWVLLNPYNGNRGSNFLPSHIWGLQASAQSATAISASTLASSCRSATTTIVRPLATTTCDIALAAGRDQAAAFASTDTVHFYHLSNGTLDLVIGSLNGPATGPLGATRPAGYVYSAYLFSVVLSGGSVPLILVRGSKVYLNAAASVIPVSVGGATTAETVTSLATQLPAIAQSMIMRVYGSIGLNAVGVSTFVFRINSGVNYALVQASTTGGYATLNSDVELPNVSQTFRWIYLVTTTAFGGAISVYLTSYTVPNGDA